MDIEGLSETTLEKLIGWGVLEHCLDIYHLNEHRDEILMIDGFGEKSWQNLWDAIQRSRDTTFERYLIAMDIPLIGNTASRALAQRFHSSLDEFEAAVCGSFDFTQLPDFGEPCTGISMAGSGRKRTGICGVNCATMCIFPHLYLNMLNRFLKTPLWD